MAIAFLTSTLNSGTNSGVPFAFDSGAAAADRYMILGAGYGPIQTFTSITYAGLAMTLLTPSPASVAPGSERLWLYGLANPPTGSNNVVAIMSDGGTYGGWEGPMAVYTGARGGVMSTPVVVSSQLTPIALPVLTIANNSWVVGFVRNASGNNVAGANTTLRGAASPLSIADTNAAQTPPGSFSLNVSWGGGLTAGGVAVSLAPSPISPMPTHFRV